MQTTEKKLESHELAHEADMSRVWGHILNQLRMEAIDIDNMSGDRGSRKAFVEALPDKVVDKHRLSKKPKPLSLHRFLDERKLRFGEWIKFRFRNS